MAKERNSTKKEIEILAPAGSYETFEAVIRAGADAVYLGGSRFGARAYANNFGEDELFRAIDYAHIHNRQVYLTVNTLFKEDELERALYEYLLPYYRQGLDAVIVQDMGAFSLIREAFPGMDIHVSTQMTVTGITGASYMKELGASRVVTAREMSLAEIREIHENVDIEIETFVHGALCYCYSGQCLLSSMLGGRSGNRGRCAQPCRLPYEVCDADKKSIKTQGNFVLSPKDMCGVRDIPALAESGVYSLKIEGRMKQAEYAAGVVSVYRAYTDCYLELLEAGRGGGKSEAEARDYAKAHFKVSEADVKKLMELGNRSGFTNSYYYRKNGPDMITFGKPNHARTNEALQNEMRETYIRAEAPDAQIKEKINGILRLKKDSPATIEVTCRGYAVKKEGSIVQPAQKQPLTIEKAEARMKKTGSTPFIFAELSVEMDENIFLPVQTLNQLRRDALQELETVMLREYRRDEPQSFAESDEPEERNFADASSGSGRITVSIEQRKQLAPVLAADFVDAVYLDSSTYGRAQLIKALREDVQAVHNAKKQAFFILPAVFRNSTAEFYSEIWQEILDTKLDGVMVKNMDAAAFVRKKAEQTAVPAIVLDHSIYTWNHRAQKLLGGLAPLYDTAPLELNKKELLRRDNRNSEILIYGNLPLMTTAQCVHANTGKCDKKPGVLYLKDRYGKYFPVKNNCAECYNVLYNTTPLLLFSYGSELSRMEPAGYRLAFTTEGTKEVGQVLELCEKTFLLGQADAKELFISDYTNGHYKRGVE